MIVISALISTGLKLTQLVEIKHKLPILFGDGFRQGGGGGEGGCSSDDLDCNNEDEGDKSPSGGGGGGCFRDNDGGLSLRDLPE